jgi:hypothetical protein
MIIIITLTLLAIEILQNDSLFKKLKISHLKIFLGEKKKLTLPFTF